MAAEGIESRSNQGLGKDGKPFKPNEAKYAARKLKRFAVDRPGELGGQMLSLPSILGRPEIGPDSVVMTYGTGELPPTSSRTGATLKDYERTATDRDKARYFAEGGREFYALDAAIAADIVKRTGEALDKYVLGGGA
jgi:hypothetical protein